MRKRLTTAGLVVALTLSMAGNAFAAGWQKNDTGWWYGTNADNTTWYANEWQWIDGNGDGVAECYCFDANGYMYENTTTPDGYTVNADGAWTLDGIVQTKEVPVPNPSPNPNPSSPTPQEIVNYLSHDVSNYWNTTPRFSVDTSKPAVTSGISNVKYIGPRSDMIKNGWLWHEYKVFSGAGGLYCAVALNEEGYLYVNTTTPDGYYVNEYGVLEINGMEVTHHNQCRFAITFPYEGSTTYKNGAPIPDKNHAYNIDNASTLEITNYAYWIIPFGSLVYNHDDYATDGTYYIDDTFTTCTQWYRAVYPNTAGKYDGPEPGLK